MRRQYTAHIASYTYHAVQPKAGSAIAHAVSEKVGG